MDPSTSIKYGGAAIAIGAAALFFYFSSRDPNDPWEIHTEKSADGKRTIEKYANGASVTMFDTKYEPPHVPGVAKDVVSFAQKDLHIMTPGKYSVNSDPTDKCRVWINDDTGKNVWNLDEAGMKQFFTDSTLGSGVPVMSGHPPTADFFHDLNQAKLDCQQQALRVARTQTAAAVHVDDAVRAVKDAEHHEEIKKARDELALKTIHLPNHNEVMDTFDRKVADKRDAQRAAVPIRHVEAALAKSHLPPATMAATTMAVAVSQQAAVVAAAKQRAVKEDISHLEHKTTAIAIMSEIQRTPHPTADQVAGWRRAWPTNSMYGPMLEPALKQHEAIMKADFKTAAANPVPVPVGFVLPAIFMYKKPM